LRASAAPSCAVTSRTWFVLRQSEIVAVSSTSHLLPDVRVR
jgi:hypothetical protein